jgi:peptide/nickel transport system ATP-binding protein
VAERVVVLYKGRIMESGPTELITDQPCHPYTRALIAAAPVANPSIQRERAARRHLLPVATPDESVSAVGCPFAPRCPSATDQCRSAAPPMTRLADGRDVACFLFTGCSTGAANQSNNKGEQ